jgi:hypothetical protein
VHSMTELKWDEKAGKLTQSGSGVGSGLVRVVGR